MQGRLLVTDKDDGMEWVNMTHESLMTRWKQFVTWRLTNRDQRRLIATGVRDAEEEWQQKQPARGLIYCRVVCWPKYGTSGVMLEPELGQSTRHYYQASDQREQQQVAFLERALTEVKAARKRQCRFSNLTAAQPVPSTAARAIRAVGTSYDKLQGQVLTPVQGDLSTL